MRLWVSITPAKPFWKYGALHCATKSVCVCVCVCVCVRWLHWSRWNTSMGENSWRSDCLSLRNKCCTLSFTLPHPLCTPLFVAPPPLRPPPPPHCLYSHLISSADQFFTTCQIFLPFLTLPPLSVFIPPIHLIPFFSSNCVRSCLLSFHFSLSFSLPTFSLHTISPLLFFSLLFCPLLKLSPLLFTSVFYLIWLLSSSSPTAIPYAISCHVLLLTLSPFLFPDFPLFCFILLFPLFPLLHHFSPLLLSLYTSFSSLPFYHLIWLLSLNLFPSLPVSSCPHLSFHVF